MVKQITNFYRALFEGWQTQGYVKESVVNQVLAGDPHKFPDDLVCLALRKYGFIHELTCEREVRATSGIFENRTFEGGWRYNVGSNHHPCPLTSRILLEVPSVGGFLPEEDLKIKLRGAYQDALNVERIETAPSFEEVYPLVVEAMQQIGWRRRVVGDVTEFFKS